MRGWRWTRHGRFRLGIESVAVPIWPNGAITGWRVHLGFRTISRIHVQ